MSWIVVPNVVAAVAITAIAGIVFLANPGGERNRWLGLALLLLGGLYAMVALIVGGDPATSAAAWRTGHAFVFLGFAAYLGFCGTMVGPLARWLGSPAVRLALGAGALLGFYAVLGPWALADGSSFYIVRLVAIAVWSVGIVVTIGAWRSARTLTQRRQMRAYAIGFLVYDGLNIVLQLISLGGYSAWLPDAVFNALLLPSAAIFLAIALGYGLVRWQLFDIDLRIKLGLRRSTLAGAFLVSFFVVSQLIEVFAGTMLGAVAGAVAAGLLLFALAPLQRAAERIADVAMPQVQDTTEYRTVRRREVYRAAVESAVEDGSITDRERSVLATLAQQLGLGPRDAYEIETEARGSLRAGAAPPA